MAIGILGRKVGMTQVFDPAGKMVPVTVVQAGPCHVLQLRTGDRDAYDAVQLGFSDRKRERATKSQRGHVAALQSKRAKKFAQSGREASPKANCEPKRFVRELRGQAVFHITQWEDVMGKDGNPTGEKKHVPKESRELKVGDEIKVDVFSGVRRVDVTGISIGRGYTGVMRRHNFKGQRATHGVKKCHRHGGSYGCRTFPGRVFKGRRMAGQYGNARTTIRNLEVVRIDEENNLLLIRGAIPGPNGGFVEIRETNKRYRKARGKAPVSKKKKAS